MRADDGTTQDDLGDAGESPRSKLETRRATGFSMTDLLELPDPARRLLQWLVRNKNSELRDVATALGWEAADASSVLSGLIEQGYVQQTAMSGKTRYSARLAPQRGRGTRPGVWNRIDDKSQE